MSKVADILGEAPQSPGVYLMKDARQGIFYVGKAKNLRARMQQYIHPLSDSRPFVQVLDRLLFSADFILTGNETEALLLEQTLIKQHRPRFNIRIKDDRHYFSLRLDTACDFPRLEFVRQRRKDKALYFGPYPSARAARLVLELVNRHFMLRDCEDDVFKRATRPCLRHQMGRCRGPCSLPVDPEDYQADLRRVRLFLEGRSQTLLDEVRQQITLAAEAWEYERAAYFRDLAKAINDTTEKQVTNLPRALNWDVVGFFREHENAAFATLRVREGLIVGRETHLVACRALPDDEVVGAFLSGTYGDVWPLPEALLLPCLPPDAEALSAWLGTRRGATVELRQPERGDGARLMEMAQANARASFEQAAPKLMAREQALERLAAALGLPKPPRRIECFDISNISGTLAVGSMVCMLEGEPARAEYRRYRIRMENAPDDFAMMREVLTRRLTRGQKSGDLPDLLVVDGGKGQLGVAEAILHDLGIHGVALAGLAKSRLKEEVGEGEIAQAFEGKLRTPERVFVPRRKNPILLKPGTGELSLLMRLRDEAHRFAITYHRLLRSRRATRSGLHDIPGIGPKRAKLLLTHFGSLKRLRQASVAEMSELPGMNAAVAELVFKHLHAPIAEPPHPPAAHEEEPNRP